MAAFNDPNRHTFSKRTIKDDFFKWLCDCHERLDKEVEFLDKVGVQEAPGHGLVTHFLTVRYGQGQDTVYRRGDKVSGQTLTD